MGKSAPKAPNPVTTANAQAAANKEAVRESALVNQINQVTPYGSTTYSGEIGSPNRTQTTTLSPEQQQQFDSQNQLAAILGNKAVGTAGQLFNEPYSMEGAPEVGTDYSAARTAAEDKVYGALTRNTERDFGRSDETLRSRLAAQGINQGSEAYDREMESAASARENALSNASLQAYQSGVTEENNAYNRDVQNRDRYLREQLQERTQPANELSAILQGTPAFQSPQYTAGGNYNVQSPDVMGAIYNNYAGQQNAYGQKASKMGQIVGSAPAAYTAFSDQHLKQNIKHIGQENGYNVYEFAYKSKPDEKYIGVMAQEVQKVKPEAVKAAPNGYLMVNYDMIGVKMRRVA